MLFEQKSEYEHMIIGAGLIGSLWALYLHKHSSSIAIFETYDDLRYDIIPGGRSINLVLSKKALDALDELHIKEEVLKNTIPIYGQIIHSDDGTMTKFPYGINENEATYCISRNKLSEILLTIVESNNIPIFFAHQLIEGDLENDEYTFKINDESEVKIKAKHLYGADGAGSKVRDLIFDITGHESDVDWFESDYKEIFLPEDQESEFGGYPLDPNWVHVWPRSGKLILGHPNKMNNFSLNVILPSEGEESFAEIDSEEKVNAFFNKFYPDLSHRIPNLSIQFSENQVGYLGTLRCPVWHYKNKAVLLGDSAHTITPFLWQAINIGMDDCLQFSKIIEEHGFSEKAFKLYEEIQKPKAFRLSEMAIEQFEIISKKNCDTKFLEMRKLEKEIEKKFPETFWSKYRMIFFGENSYEEIFEKSPRFEETLQQIYEKRIHIENLSEFLNEKL